MLGQYDPETRERLAALTRVIVESPSRLANEKQKKNSYKHKQEKKINRSSPATRARWPS
jgi:hypothetical protein